MSDKKIKKTGGVAGDSEICSVSSENGHGLFYFGYSIYDLASEKNANFSEVAYLLLHKKLPNKQQLKAFELELIEYRQIPKNLCEVLHLIPKDARPMDIVRTACSFLGDIEAEEEDFANQLNIAKRMLGVFPSILVYHYNYHFYAKEIGFDSKQVSIGGYFLEKLRENAPEGELSKVPTDIEIQAMEVSLILYAEHEFNASTFASRIVSSTRSDIYSAVCAGIGALRGNLHGGANEAVMYMVEDFRSVDQAMEVMKDKLATKQLIMGFGHRVYTVSDPRSDVIKDWVGKLSESMTGAAKQDAENKFLIHQEIEKLMWEEKKLFPNLDFYSALVYHFMGIPTNFFTPIFVCARTSGWCAHIFEQRANNKLIRPSSNYIGLKPQEYIELNDRK